MSDGRIIPYSCKLFKLKEVYILTFIITERYDQATLSL